MGRIVTEERLLSCLKDNFDSTLFEKITIIAIIIDSKYLTSVSRYRNRGVDLDIL
jgi:hypothetical protein